MCFRYYNNFIFFLIFFCSLGYSYVNISDCGTIDAVALAGETEIRLNKTISDRVGDCFTITTNNFIFECQGYIVDGDGDNVGSGFVLNGRNNVTIDNCEIKEFNHGIYLSGTTYSDILNCNTSYNGMGVRLVSTSTNNNIDNLVSSYNSGHSSGAGYDDGIAFESSSSYNNLSNSILSNNNDNGITIYSNSDNNIIENCIFDNNANSANLGSISIFSSTDNNIVRNNKILNTPPTKYHLYGDGTNNTVYNNYFDSSTSNIDSSFIYNITYLGNNIGNFWEGFVCNDFEIRGNYKVCINPVSYSGIDFAPLSIWYDPSSSSSSNNIASNSFPLINNKSILFSLITIIIYLIL